MACRDAVRRIIPQIEEVLRAGDLPPSAPPDDAVGPVFPDDPASGDGGHCG